MPDLVTGNRVKYSDLYLGKIQKQWREEYAGYRGYITERFTEDEIGYAVVQWDDGPTWIHALDHLDKEDENA